MGGVPGEWPVPALVEISGGKVVIWTHFEPIFSGVQVIESDFLFCFQYKIITWEVLGFNDDHKKIKGGRNGGLIGTCTCFLGTFKRDIQFYEWEEKSGFVYVNLV